MFEMFLLWATLLIVLCMLVAAPLPDRLRAFGLVGAVMTVWILWALFGVELLADAKWPQSGENDDVTENRTERLGQVGDLFGGVNALFAALAFSGVGIAAFQQWKSTRLAFKQSVEATFFSAVDLHHRITESLRFDRARIFPSQRAFLLRQVQLAGIVKMDVPEIAVGRQVFVEVLKSISHSENEESAYSQLIERYKFLQNQHNYVLGHYFRNLYQILKMIDADESLDDTGKQKYASILRAQLSSDELALLMINCTDTIVDHGEFRSLLIHYRMLEHVPLIKQGRQYLYAGQSASVVLAEESTIDQFLSDPRPSRMKKVHRGAFGANPAIGSPHAASVPRTDA